MKEIKEILVQNILPIGLLVFLCVAVYFNGLGGEFAVVDDLTSFVENEENRDLVRNFKALDLQLIVYSLSYRLFGINPLPLHLVSLTLHAIVTILAFISLYTLFGRGISLIASLLFAVHPVNTETVTWISGSPYLWNTLFAYLVIVPFILYRRWRGGRRYRHLITSAIIYVLALILVRSPWTLIVPPALVVIDQFFCSKKLSFRSGARFLLFIIPALIFFFGVIYSRQVERSAPEEGITSVTLNQQSLTRLQSYPYTIYSMWKLYIFPKDLTIYYDGNPITNVTRASMFVVSAIFIIAIIYFWKKNRKVVGTFLMLLVLIAPALSPFRLTWFIAERYLYFGTVFFGALVAMLLLQLEKKTGIKRLSVILTALLVITYSFRTIVRNNDWKTPKALALATIKTSPYSVRAYNDLGNIYLMEEDYERATQYYREALEIFPRSGTAVHNLGIVYLRSGIPDMPETADPVRFQQLFTKGVNAFRDKFYEDALFYFGEALRINPNSAEANEAAGSIYAVRGKLDFAFKHFSQAIELDPTKELSWYMLGRIEQKWENIEAARKYFTRTLDVNPEHLGAREGLEKIQ